ncbi:MAG TPA: DUF309 domain-containing protein [Gemmataceae bacterium]|nr:DUF309 domain-containing protein [Gemmataceae bacterium]
MAHALPRLVPDALFPAYSFVPGRFPHPVSDPAGHSYGAVAPAAPVLVPERWADNLRYLFGIDLFNAGYYWEAHEAWESLWHVCGRTGRTADFLKGLIKLAAAGVKVREDRPQGAAGHARAAADLFRRTGAPQERYLGLPLGELIDFAEAIATDAPTATDPAAPVEIVFRFALRPEQG